MLCVCIEVALSAIPYYVIIYPKKKNQKNKKQKHSMHIYVHSVSSSNFGFGEMRFRKAVHYYYSIII